MAEAVNTDLLGPFATISSPADHIAYQLTPADVLWAARMAQYEGGTDVAATLWTVTQRFVYLHDGMTGTLGHQPTFTEFARAFSQPINPAWDEPTDAKCIANPTRCTDAQLSRRHSAATKPWARLDSRIRATVLKWAAASLPNPVPRSVDFADAAVSQHFLDRNPGAVIIRRPATGTSPRLTACIGTRTAS